jgi:hypothetical protein
MDKLSAFGLFAVTAGLVCYALEERSPWFHFGLRCCMRPWFGVRFSARSLGIRSNRSGLVPCRFAEMVESETIVFHRAVMRLREHRMFRGRLYYNAVPKTIRTAAEEVNCFRSQQVWACLAE